MRRAWTGTPFLRYRHILLQLLSIILVLGNLSHRPSSFGPHSHHREAAPYPPLREALPSVSESVVTEI
ncbi:hypothetical protein PsYK624_012570 [Phanerochaete sordida]|uniref:Secreted protein n=1 Tax=Phanerochaete sordida TaxID=48140 RepID=A0A9P3L860_9APHY|nr:hypothetical protein PsYK624_012570 [Phanerochaete sordida]